jgi:hypothetical protein
MASGYSSAVLSASPLSSTRLLLQALGALLALGMASCGGSSSETPPPLEPLPANVHYNRSATSLPGELGTPARPAASALPVDAAPAPPPASGH